MNQRKDATTARDLGAAPAEPEQSDPARSAIADAIAVARISGDSPWIAAGTVLTALDRAGYVVTPKPALLLAMREMTAQEADEFRQRLDAATAPRASQAATAPQEPGGDAGDGRDGHRAAGGSTGARVEVPAELLALARAGFTKAYDDKGIDVSTLCDLTNALAAVIPAIRAQALAPVLAEHPRDDTNPHGPWCPTCTVPWPCRTVRAARGDS